MTAVSPLVIFLDLGGFILSLILLSRYLFLSMQSKHWQNIFWRGLIIGSGTFCCVSSFILLSGSGGDNNLDLALWLSILTGISTALFSILSDLFSVTSLLIVTRYVKGLETPDKSIKNDQDSNQRRSEDSR